MKIALCFSGTVRTLHDTIQNNLDFFAGNELDLYFSVWDHVGYSDKINSPDHELTQRKIHSQITQELLESIVPHHISNFHIEKFDINNLDFDIINGISPPDLGSQYLKIADCFDLIAHPNDYDAIVRLRCDVLLQNKMPENWLIFQLQNDKIIFPSIIWFNYPKADNSSINEMIWISSPKYASKLSNTYNNQLLINNLIRNRKSDIVNTGEYITYMNLETHGLQNNVVLHDFDYKVLR